MGDTPLDRLDKQVRERYQKEQEKVDAFHTQREVEKSHSRISRPDLSCRSRQWQKQDLLKACTPPKDKEKIYKCGLVNCEVEFNNRQLYEEHVMGSSHSPCNPLKYMMNGRLPHNRTAHMCSECGLIYKDCEACLEHMSASGHNVLQLPMKLAGYICPECLSVFHDKSSCVEHMERMKHCYIQYPFKDDLESSPVPIPTETLELFLQKCSEVNFHYVCHKCYDPTANAHHHHDRKRVNADMSHGEVFASLMKSHTCIQCLRLFDNVCQTDLNLGIHYCSDTDVGMYIENDCRRFAEFLRRLALPDHGTQTGPKTRHIQSINHASSKNVDRKDSVNFVGKFYPGDDHLNLLDKNSDNDVELLPPPVKAVTDFSCELEQLHSPKLESVGYKGKNATSDIECEKIAELIVAPLESNNNNSPVASPKYMKNRDLNINISTAVDKLDHRVIKRAHHPQRRCLHSTDLFANVTESKSSTCSNKGGIQRTGMSKRKQCTSVSLRRSVSNEKRQRTEEEPMDCNNTHNDKINKEDGFSCECSEKMAQVELQMSKTKGNGCLLSKTESQDNVSQSVNCLAETTKIELEKSINQMDDDVVSIIKVQIDRNQNILPQPGCSFPEPMDTKWDRDTGDTSNATESDKILRRRERNRRKRHRKKLKKQLQAKANENITVYQKPNTWGVPEFTFDLELPKYSQPFGPSSENTTSVKHKFPESLIGASGAEGSTSGFHHRVENNIGTCSLQYNASDIPTNGRMILNSSKSGQSEPGDGTYLASQKRKEACEYMDTNNGSITSPTRNRCAAYREDCVTVGNQRARNNAILPKLQIPVSSVTTQEDMPQSPRCEAYLNCKQNQCFYLHKKCSRRKDAADFAICMWIGRMDERLPKEIPFTVLSGDAGFAEIEEQMKLSERRTRVINPHQKDADIVYTLIKSVADA